MKNQKFSFPFFVVCLKFRSRLFFSELCDIVWSISLDMTFLCARDRRSGGGGHIVFVPTVIPEFYNVILSEKLTLLITLDSRDGSVEERSSRMRENGVLPLVLIVWALLSQSRIFHSHGDVTITGEGLQILTYARHSWSLHIEGSLTCSTDWYTWHPFTMVISEDPRRSHILMSVSSRAVTTFFYDLGYVAAGIRTPNLSLAKPTL